ncbi:MAG: hypothetical protein IT475_04220 [Aquimonas sp.]|nr:hypothetical protein [Aquimonas sp.]
MSDTYTDYELLLNRFLEGEQSAEEFQHVYLARFKGEERKLDEPFFELLDGLFGDVDAFTTDQELIADNPGFYLNEVALREKVYLVLKQLVRLQQAK